MDRLTDEDDADHQHHDRWDLGDTRGSNRAKAVYDIAVDDVGKACPAQPQPKILIVQPGSGIVSYSGLASHGVHQHQHAVRLMTSLSLSIEVCTTGFAEVANDVYLVAFSTEI